MAITQSELVTALQTLLNTVKFRIRNRYGVESVLDLNRMKAGELAFCTDTRRLYACFTDGQAQLVSNGLVIKGYYANLSALQTAHPAGAAGDIYAVGSSPQHLYLWTTAWTDMGAWNDMSLYATAASLTASEQRSSPIGEVKAWPTRRVPAKYLACDGSAVSRIAYPDLFAVLCYAMGAVTISIASPGAVTLTGHGFADGDSIYLTTTGALPTGLTANTLYYVKYVDANTFQLSATRGGTAINTSGTQSGVHTIFDCPHGLGDGSTTFNVPDGKRRSIVGRDTSGANFNNIGEQIGAETHTHTTKVLGGVYSLNKAGLHYINASATDGVSDYDFPSSAASSYQPSVIMLHIIRALA